MLNNLLFDVPCCMCNNLNVMIKIFSTIYLLWAVLFTYVPLEGMTILFLVTIGLMSLGSTRVETFSLKRLKYDEIPSVVYQQLLDL